MIVHFVALLTVVSTPAHAEATFESRAVELINQARAAAGAPPVQVLPALAAVAGDAPYDGCGFPVAGRSADMGVRNYFGHVVLGCGNRGVGDMLSAGGASYSGVAENIAWAGALTDPMIAAERLHNDLMASPSHRNNILNPASTHVGVGSWRSAAGVSWTGGGGPVRNVFVTTQIFTSSAGGQAAASSGARYHPLPPRRILDTRAANPLGPGGSMSLQVAGAGGVPASGVSAVVLNVTVTGPTAASFLSVFPAGEGLPATSSLNYGAGLTVANLVTAKLGSGGRLSLYNAAGSTHVVVDVAGWYGDGTDTSGARFHPAPPSRILDTRQSAPVGPDAAITLQVAGRGGVPATGVSAVVMNLTATEPTTGGFVTVFPAGDPLPLASNLNFDAGTTRPNLVTARLGSGGGVHLYNAAGSTHLIVDVAGWYDDGSLATGVGFHPVSPSRILDTRNGSGPVGPSTAMNLQVAGQGGVPASGATAVVMNVTVTEPSTMSALGAFPTGEGYPGTSNLNFVAGQTVPNLVVAKLGAGGRVSMHNIAGSTHVIADVAGWFGTG